MSRSGQGAYGNVVLVRVRPRTNPNKIERPGSVFAMKILNKTEMQSFDEVRSLLLTNLGAI